MSEIPRSEELKKPNERTNQQLAMAVIALGEAQPENVQLLNEVANRVEQLDRLNRLLGLLAPGGTAPRAVIEELYIQSETNSEVSPMVLELRRMLAEHWAEWTPVIRDAKGLPAVNLSDFERKKAQWPTVVTMESFPDKETAYEFVMYCLKTIYKSSGVDHWWSNPNRGLDGRIPYEVWEESPQLVVNAAMRVLV